MTTRTVLGFARLTAAIIFAGKRRWAAILLAGLPPFITLAIVLLAGERVNGSHLFDVIVFWVTLYIVMYLLALIFGIAFSSGEIEEGTMGYIYLGALPKWAVTLVQITVVWIALTAVLFASILLTALAAGVAVRAPLEAPFQKAALCTVLGSIGILTSLSFYVTCGLMFRHPLVISIIVTFIWEFLITTFIPVKFAAWTVTNNLRTLMLPLIFEGKPWRRYRYVRNYELPSYGQAAMYLSVLAGFFLVTAMVASMNRSVAGKEAR